MFSFNEQSSTKFKSQLNARVPTYDNRAGTQPKGHATTTTTTTAQLRSFIDRLGLTKKPSGGGGSFNVKLKQQSQQLCAKLNQLQYGRRLKDDLQKSLGKLVQSGGGRKLATTSKRASGASAHSRLENATRRTRSSCGSGGSIVIASAIVGAKKQPVLQRSLSLNPRPSLCRSTNQTVAAARQPATVKRNEWATRSLHQAKLAAIGQRGPSENADDATVDKAVARAIKQQPRQPLAARLMRWPLLAPIGSAAVDGRRQKQRKMKQADCDKSRPQSIVSLLSSAAASRRQNNQRRRLATGGSGGRNRMPFVFVVALHLLLAICVSVLAPFQPLSVVECAPISQQFVSIKPIWLSDGLMDVSDSNSLDSDNPQADSYQESTSEDGATIARDLLDRMATTMRQQQQQQQGELDANEQQVADRVSLEHLERQREPPKRSWFSMASKQEEEEEGDQGQEPMRQVNMKRRADQPTSGQEYLWIERRRLNRDRALEPPAWLRTRPIRRDVASSDGNDGPSSQMGESAIRPIRRRSSRGRQLRESSSGASASYDQILRHLLEEALENGSLLTELYDDLDETRTRAGQQQQRPTVGKMTQQQQPDASMQTGAATADKGTGASKQLEGGQEGGILVLAGDEISSEDDVTPVDSPSSLAAPAAGPPSSAPLTLGRGEQPNSLLMMRSPVGELTSIDAGAMTSGGLLELMKQGAVDQQQQPSFHVVEDIDQADSSQEVIQQQPEQQQQQSSEQSAGPGVGPAAGSAFQLDKRSIELDSSVVGDFKEEERDAEGQDKEASTSGESQGPEEQLAAPSQTSKQVMVARRASFGRGAEDELPMREQQPEQVRVDRSLGATAIRLIRAGYFSRAQLVMFATKLRVFLENRLGLARGAIVGLFPIDKQQLLVELNPARLTQSDRQMLARTFDYSRKSNSLVLSWPSGPAAAAAGSQLPAENPLPILSAILGALYDDEPDETTTTTTDDDERMQFEGAPTRADGDQPTGVQINELPPVASALAARDSSRQRDPAEEVELVRDDDDKDDKDDKDDETDGQDQEAEQQSQSLLMSPQSLGRIQPTRRYVPGPAPQLSEAPAPLSLPFAPAAVGMDQQLGWGPPWPQPWDEYYQSRRRQALLAGYLSALYGLNQQQQQPVFPADFAPLWQRDPPAVGASQLGVARGGVSAPDTPNATAAAAAVPAIYRRLLAVLGYDSLAASSPLIVSQQPISNEQEKPLTSHLWSHHLLAMVLALAVTFVIVKLILRRLDTTKRDGKRRRLSTMTGSSSSSTFCERARLWSVAPSKWWGPQVGAGPEELACGDTIKGETQSASGKQHPLGRAFAGYTSSNSNPSEKHRPSADSGLETIDGTEVGGVAGLAGSSEKFRRSFEHLTRRLTRLLSIMRTDEQRLQKCENAELATALEGAAGIGGGQQVGVAAQPEQQQQQFRSSTSYIRSLIEALTKAASAQMGQVSVLNDDDDDDDDDKLASLESGSRTLAAKQAQAEQQVFQPEDETEEILMAQMDISAAHLILDYMEKHLVDKERLRREWLELNGAAAAATPVANNNGRGPVAVAALPAPSASVTTSKANQLVLQRLAKYALNEDNYHKNRNPNVVPFDRNRVRLGAGKRPVGANGCELPASPAPTSSKQKLRNQRNVRNGSRNSAGLDYINASFIYDDDPRRATHIIAQGPKEQTCGQFWQMVWEQEISVIVMLTRLNENSAQMCHCYWPTQIGPATGQVAGSGELADAAGKGPELSPPPPLGGGARRGSVTSVFSSLAATKHHPNAAPSAIVAGALNDTALYFELPLTPLLATSRSGSRQTSRSSAEDDLDEAGGTTTSSSGSDRQQRLRATAAAATAKTLKLEVRLISEHVSSSDYLVRNMYLINQATGETRTISQFHYLAWQEARTPESVRSFLQFRRKVHKSYRQAASPILVHCSDGAGRSGTYALIDIVLERIRNGAKEIDLRATLEHLRDQRIGLCENQAQFEFVLVALAEEIQIILNALPR